VDSGKEPRPGAPTVRQRKAQAAKAHIFDTAVRIIKRDGYDKTRITDICRSAGVSTGAFYHYFASKQDILSELYLRADVFFEDYMRHREAGKSAVEQVKEYMALYIHFVTLEGLSNGMDMCKNLYTPGNKLFTKADRSMLTLLEQIIGEGQAKGELSKKFSPKEWVNFLFLVLRGIVFDWVLRSGVYNIEEYTKPYLECLGNYIQSSTADGVKA
jgi:AcrR family transcriptional regulator